MSTPLRIAFSLGVSALFVWLSLRSAPLSDVAAALRAADWRPVAAYGLLLLGIHVIRVVRWQLLLAPVARVPFRDLNPITAVGFGALMLLPLRLGELARPLLAGSHLGLRRTTALASVVVERLVDGLFVGLLLVLLLWTIPMAAGAPAAAYLAAALVVTAGFAAGLGLLFVAFRRRAWTERLLHRLAGRFSPALATRLSSMFAGFAEALRVVPDTRAGLKLLGLTGALWGVAGLGLLVVAPAFGFTLTPGQALTVLGLQTVGSMLPAGPGMVGTHQFATIQALRLFLPAEAQAAAVACAHVVWAAQVSLQVLLGLAYVATGRVRLDGLRADLRAPPPRPAPGLD